MPGGSTPFAQLDLRIDKIFYFKGVHAGLLRRRSERNGQQAPAARRGDVHGVIENPDAPLSEQRYRMKFISQVSGTLLPSIGITVEF